MTVVLIPFSISKLPIDAQTTPLPTPEVTPPNTAIRLFKNKIPPFHKWTVSKAAGAFTMRLSFITFVALRPVSSKKAPGNRP